MRSGCGYYIMRFLWKTTEGGLGGFYVISPVQYVIATDVMQLQDRIRKIINFLESYASVILEFFNREPIMQCFYLLCLVTKKQKSRPTKN